MTSALPPLAKRVPSERSHHGETFTDEYAWLISKDDPDTLAYLKAENAFSEQQTAHLATLRETLFAEIKNKTQETDLSVPVRKGDFWYYTRTVEGKQYGIHCRVPAEGSVPPVPAPGTALPGEQVLLDENELAGEAEFFSMGAFDVSPDGTLLAYSTDYAGDERYTLRVKNLVTGEVLPDEIPGTFYGTAWSAAGDHLFYLTVDEAWRPYRVWRHALGSEQPDVVVHEEADERFWTGISLTRSEQYIIIDLHSKVTSEIRLIPAADPTAEPVVFGTGRREGVEVSVDHQGDRFVVLHNDQAENFTIGWTPVTDTNQFHELIAHREDTRLLDVDAFDGHLVVHFRRDGLSGLRIVPNEGEAREITFPEPVYTVSPDANPRYAADTYRLRYNSLATPDSVYDCWVATGELTLLKRKPVLGDFDPADYEQHREWAVAEDGTRIPISLMCKKGTVRDSSAPLLLYGYGSYETSMDPWFSIARLSLVDRGVVYAIAHVRGGGEMGRRWYDDGKLLKKKNTFTDFVACARHLAAAGWTSPGKTVARGGSAGGLLMGAIANLAPEAFGGIVAEVPFVDALNTILDPTMPLTVVEWDEWGNPLADPAVYAYMKSYSPYENVAARDYPPILATAGLNDPRVGYHEAAKWVAKLRATGKGGQVLLKTEMGAGHMGPSGRYDAWKEEAFVLAWVLDAVGLA
ncbi:S9 family peptidase [Longispora albida]|uniref:S9 family peptidase n=1 Tax=Longispora albida TaxID=203523 RepID=UPI00037FEBC2|nr:S9 family peptidase [Longispora albida]